MEEETDPATYLVTREVCERLQRFPRIRNCCMGGCFEKAGTRRPVPIVGYENAQRNKILPGTISTRGPGGPGQEHPTSAIWFLNGDPSANSRIAAVCSLRKLHFVLARDTTTLFASLKTLALLGDLQEAHVNELADLTRDFWSGAGCHNDTMELVVQQQAGEQHLCSPTKNKQKTACVLGCTACTRMITHWQCQPCAEMAKCLCTLAAQWRTFDHVKASDPDCQITISVRYTFAEPNADKFELELHSLICGDPHLLKFQRTAAVNLASLVFSVLNFVPSNLEFEKMVTGLTSSCSPFSTSKEYLLCGERDVLDCVDEALTQAQPVKAGPLKTSTLSSSLHRKKSPPPSHETVLQRMRAGERLLTSAQGVASTAAAAYTLAAERAEQILGTSMQEAAKQMHHAAEKVQTATQKMQEALLAVITARTAAHTAAWTADSQEAETKALMQAASQRREAASTHVRAVLSSECLQVQAAADAQAEAVILAEDAIYATQELWRKTQSARNAAQQYEHAVERLQEAARAQVKAAKAQVQAAAQAHTACDQLQPSERVPAAGTAATPAGQVYDATMQMSAAATQLAALQEAWMRPGLEQREGLFEVGLTTEEQSEQVAELEQISLSAGTDFNAESAFIMLRMQLLEKRRMDLVGYYECGRVRIVLRCYHIMSLLPGGWLNDSIIEFYLRLLVDAGNAGCASGSPSFQVLGNSYCMSNLRVLPKIGTDSPALLFVPFNDSNVHWVLGVIKTVAREALVYDSLAGRCLIQIDLLKEYLEYSDQDVSTWSIRVADDAVRQSNGYDCGLFLLMHAECAIRGIVPSSTEVVERDQLIWELHHRCLLRQRQLKCPSESGRWFVDDQLDSPTADRMANDKASPLKAALEAELDGSNSSPALEHLANASRSAPDHGECVDGVPSCTRVWTYDTLPRVGMETSTAAHNMFGHFVGVVPGLLPGVVSTISLGVGPATKLVHFSYVYVDAKGAIKISDPARNGLCLLSCIVRALVGQKCPKLDDLQMMGLSRVSTMAYSLRSSHVISWASTQAYRELFTTEVLESMRAHGVLDPADQLAALFLSPSHSYSDLTVCQGEWLPAAAKLWGINLSVITVEKGPGTDGQPSTAMSVLHISDSNGVARLVRDQHVIEPRTPAQETAQKAQNLLGQPPWKRAAALQAMNAKTRDATLGAMAEAVTDMNCQAMQEQLTAMLVRDLGQGESLAAGLMCMEPGTLKATIEAMERPERETILRSATLIEARILLANMDQDEASKLLSRLECNHRAAVVACMPYAQRSAALRAMTTGSMEATLNAMSYQEALAAFAPDAHAVFQCASSKELVKLAPSFDSQMWGTVTPKDKEVLAGIARIGVTTTVIDLGAGDGSWFTDLGIHGYGIEKASREDVRRCRERPKEMVDAHIDYESDFCNVRTWSPELLEAMRAQDQVLIAMGTNFTGPELIQVMYWISTAPHGSRAILMSNLDPLALYEMTEATTRKIFEEQKSNEPRPRNLDDPPPCRFYGVQGLAKIHVLDEREVCVDWSCVRHRVHVIFVDRSMQAAITGVASECMKTSISLASVLTLATAQTPLATRIREGSSYHVRTPPGPWGLIWRADLPALDGVPQVGVVARSRIQPAAVICRMKFKTKDCLRQTEVKSGAASHYNIEISSGFLNIHNCLCPLTFVNHAPGDKANARMCAFREVVEGSERYIYVTLAAIAEIPAGHEILLDYFPGDRPEAEPAAEMPRHCDAISDDYFLSMKLLAESVLNPSLRTCTIRTRSARRRPMDGPSAFMIVTLGSERCGTPTIWADEWTHHTLLDNGVPVRIVGRKDPRDVQDPENLENPETRYTRKVLWPRDVQEKQP